RAFPLRKFDTIASFLVLFTLLSTYALVKTSIHSIGSLLLSPEKIEKSINLYFLEFVVATAAQVALLLNILFMPLKVFEVLVGYPIREKKFVVNFVLGIGTYW
ncbi:3253_t:CDS:1, partial [Dentiscutata erythropus]